MDTDSPRPNCPYCGGGMQFKETASGFEARSAFECRGCRVVLSVPPGARVFEMARVPAGNG
jgi:transposase-like protein